MSPREQLEGLRAGAFRRLPDEAVDVLRRALADMDAADAEVRRLREDAAVSAKTIADLSDEIATLRARPEPVAPAAPADPVPQIARWIGTHRATASRKNDPREALLDQLLTGLARGAWK